MGASSSSPVAAPVGAEAMMAAPPQGCPMHKEAQPVKGTVWKDEATIMLCNVTIMLMDDFNNG